MFWAIFFKKRLIQSDESILKRIPGFRAREREGALPKDSVQS